MNGHPFNLQHAPLLALPSGALWWAEADLLCVADLHLGKSERIARRGGTMLPPYETGDTLVRLKADLAATKAKTVVSLGDSFDDDAAGAALAPADSSRLAALQTGRRWIWISGNHDPGAAARAGAAADELTTGPLTFRHIATARAQGEVSGHYHPKARLTFRGASVSRPCLLYDATRVILPAYGTYTGGLDWTAPVLQALMGERACAVLIGARPQPVPLPRAGLGRGRAARAAAVSRTRS